MRSSRMILLLLLLGASAAAPTAVHGERATAVEMERVSENWLAYMVYERGSWAGDRHPAIVSVSALYDGDLLLARVYSIEPRGYIVVPVLKELPPVKAYSDESNLDVRATGGFAQLLRDVLRDRLDRFTGAFGSLDAVQPARGLRVFDPVNREEWGRFLADPVHLFSDLHTGTRAPLTEVGPLLTSAWDQGPPYDNLCPAGDGGQCLVGCVATAAAQVLRYHEWPTTGVGSHNYTWDGDQSCGGDVGGGLLTASFADEYDWANMPDDCSGGCSPAEQAALAELNYEVGVAYEMDYGACGSGAYTADAVNVFPTYFRYESDIDQEDRIDHTPESWFEIIKGEINSARPMVYRILGHSIVCDGWRDTGGEMQYHMNYGWADPHTTWYVLDNLYISDDPNDEFLIRRIIPESWKILVKADGSGDYPTIQAAIDSVPTGYIIELDDGTYTGVGNRDLTFRGKELTLRSLNDNPDLCIIDCQGLSRGITFDSNEGQGSILQGITIIDGYASGASPDDLGGAVYLCGTCPIIANCKCLDSEAVGDGGGVCCDSASVTLIDCVIDGNTSGGAGGGIRIAGTSSPEILGTAIRANVADHSGGGVAVLAPAEATFDECEIAGNSTETSPTNEQGGGGLLAASPVTITTCAFHGNRSAGHGGGLHILLHAGSEPVIEECTVAGNAADSTGGGIYYAGTSSPLIEESIIWANCAAVAGNNVYLGDWNPDMRFGCCDVDTTQIEGPGTFQWLWSNIVEVPGFCDPVDCTGAPTVLGDYHLKDVSPCADANAPPVCGLIGALDVGCTSAIVTVCHDGGGDYPDIQTAVDSLPDYDIIELCSGTFTGSGNRDIRFGGKTLTIRSQSGTADSCVIDCQNLGRAFQFDSGEGAAAIVQDITMINGAASHGGAVYCQASSPTLTGCVIHGNTASLSGGAVYCCDQAAPGVEHCTLSGNSAPTGAGVLCGSSSPTLTHTIVAFGVGGEAVACDSTGGSPVLTCSNLYGNAGGDWVGCVSGQGGSDGNFSADPLFCDTLIMDYTLFSNSPCVDAAGCGQVGALGVGCFANRVWHVPAEAPNIQAGIDSASAGDTVLVACGTYNEYAIIMKSGVILRSETGLADCVTIDALGQGRIITCIDVDSAASIEGFTLAGGLASGGWPANAGGGIYCENASPVVSDCCFRENTATYGGGIACRSSEPTVLGCTFADNAASTQGGGIYSYYFSSVTVGNTIIASSSDGEAVYCTYGGSAALSCSDVYGNAGGDWTGCISGQDGSNGNISEDPMFCSAAADDYSINEDSPCAPAHSPAGCNLIGALPVGCTNTAVAGQEGTLPSRFHLAPNVPNPFNPITEISYGIPRGAGLSRVTLTVYDCQGRRVRTLLDADQGAGAYTIVWDGKDHHGAAVASGVYFAHLRWSGKSETQRMVLLK